MIMQNFVFNDTATAEIYTLSLHDALPIFEIHQQHVGAGADALVELILAVPGGEQERAHQAGRFFMKARSEEHMSELQSRQYLVCRLLLEKKPGSLCLYLETI